MPRGARARGAGWPDDDYRGRRSAFAVTEALGGKLIRLALPAAKECEVADHYGLQLAATLLSDERTVACGDQISRDLLGLARRVAKTDVTVLSMGRPAPARKFWPALSITIPSVPKHRSLR